MGCKYLSWKFVMNVYQPRMFTLDAIDTQFTLKWSGSNITKENSLIIHSYGQTITVYSSHRNSKLWLFVSYKRSTVQANFYGLLQSDNTILQFIVFESLIYYFKETIVLEN